MMGTRVGRIWHWGIGIMVGGWGIRVMIGGRAVMHWHWGVPIRCGWCRSKTMMLNWVLGVRRGYGEKTGNYLKKIEFCRDGFSIVRKGTSINNANQEMREDRTKMC